MLINLIKCLKNGITEVLLKLGVFEDTLLGEKFICLFISTD